MTQPSWEGFDGHEPYDVGTKEVDWGMCGGGPMVSTDSNSTSDSTTFSSASAIYSDYTAATTMTSISLEDTMYSPSIEKGQFTPEWPALENMALGEPSGTGSPPDIPGDRPTPSSIPWDMEVMKVHDFYDFIVGKGKEPYFRLKGQYSTYSVPLMPQLVYLDKESEISHKKRHPCLYPGRTCWKLSRPVFARHADLERHYNVIHFGSNVKQLFSCDYTKCSRHNDPFTRKDHCRDHYMRFHKEDIRVPNDGKLTHGRGCWEEKQREWKAERYRDPEWWRCSQCLERVHVKKNGWTCSGCKRECDASRIIARTKQPTSSRKAEKSLVDSSLPDYHSSDQHCNMCQGIGAVQNKMGSFDACPCTSNEYYADSLSDVDVPLYDDTRYDYTPPKWHGPLVASSVAPVKGAKRETSIPKTNPQQDLSSLRTIPFPSSTLQQRRALSPESGMKSLAIDQKQSRFQSSSILLGKSLEEDCKKNDRRTISERSQSIEDCVSQPEQNEDSEGTNTISTTDESEYDSEMSLMEEVETILGPDFSHLAGLVITKIDLISRNHSGQWNFEDGKRCAGDHTSTSSSHTSGASVSTTSSDTNGGKRKSNNGFKDNQINDSNDGEGNDDEHGIPKKRRKDSSRTDPVRYDCPVSKRAINAENAQPSQSRACAPGGLEFRHVWQHIRNTHYGCETCGKSLKEKTADRKHLREREKNPATCTAKAENFFRFEVGLDLFDKMESIYYEKLPHKEKWIKWWQVTHPSEFQAPDPLHHGKLTISMEDIPQLQDLFKEMWFKEPSLPLMDENQTQIMLRLLEKLFQFCPIIHQQRRQRTQGQTPISGEVLSQTIPQAVGMSANFQQLYNIGWGEMDFMAGVSDNTGVTLPIDDLQTNSENPTFGFDDTHFSTQLKQFSGGQNEADSVLKR